ncbi:RWD domain-containing protein 1-like [Watersipora subatra]|uniref:RWD domain-containing protein 1-like n=1 Tax=Watersipora subatra TaxID=2589382 RepID=UPI00355BFAEE
MSDEDRYKEEQIGEIEALESIYPDELEVLETKPYHIFTITTRSQETHETERQQDAVGCVLTFTFTPKYPDEAPLMEVDSEVLNEERISELMTLKESLVEENLGMSMIFAIVASVIEKMNEYFDENTKNREEAIERAIKLAEEAERKKFEGTKCTVENFMAWKIKFDEEKRLERKALKMKEPDANKLTGYELFMRDQTLDDSDLKLLDPEDIGMVDVDESLFDDMEDLELEEEIS